MRIIVCETYEEMSKKAAAIVAGQIAIKPDCVLGLPTGSTPVGMYTILGEMNKNGEVDFSEVVTFNLDEYYKIDPKNEQSYRYFMNDKLFSKINIKPENAHVLYGLAEDPEAECAQYEDMISQSGGIDLQVLGIGQNGHIGFNEPDSALNAVTHLTSLTESTVNANSIFFASRDEMPRSALTMGIGSILKARKIILLANGENKRDAVRALLNNEITTDVPASILKVHPDVTLICEKAAIGDIEIG